VSGAIVNRVRRRYAFKDASESAQIARKIGTHTAHVAHTIVDSEVAFYPTLTLFAIAAHHDMMEAANKPVITYSDDVADMIGWSSARVSDFCRELKKHGLIKGTTAAGWQLDGPARKSP
jgi:hypothetical protein